jgi:hypothetical protein
MNGKSYLLDEEFLLRPWSLAALNDDELMLS